MAGSECNDLNPSYPGVASTEGSSVPTANGGSIVEGTYVLTGVSLVPNPGYTLKIDPTPVTQVLRFEGGLVSLARSVAGKTQRITGSYETKCEQITLRALCPATNTEIGQYTADADKLTLIFPTDGAKVVSRYNRVQGAGGAGGAAGSTGGASGQSGASGQGGSAGAATCGASLPGNASCASCLADKCCARAETCQYGSTDCLACFKAGASQTCLEQSTFYSLAICGHLLCAAQCTQFASCDILFAQDEPCRTCLESSCCDETAAMLVTGTSPCLDPDSGFEFSFCKTDPKYNAYRACRTSSCATQCPAFF